MLTERQNIAQPSYLKIYNKKYMFFRKRLKDQNLNKI